ncbi:hypothetical protein FRX31_032858, partial [Thalictrum thalictroides]
MFRIVYEGTWEQGEEPVLFPDRKEKLEGCGDPATIVDLYWLWGQRRFHIAKDVDILYFWKHAAHDDRGYTELIVHTEYVAPLQMVDPNYETNVCTPKKNTTPRKKTTPKHRTPKKRTKQIGGDQLVEEANKKRRKKLPIKRKIPTNEQFVSRGDKDEGSNAEKQGECIVNEVEDQPEEGLNAEKQGKNIFNEVEDQPEERLNAEKQGKNIFNEVEDQTQEGSNGEELVEDLSKDGGHKVGEGSNDVGDDPYLVDVIVTFLGKTFNIDQLDASDEEYISGDEDNEESEKDDEEEENAESYIFRKRQQQEQRETKKDKMEGPSEPTPSDEAYESDDDNDREFIMKTKEVDDNENEERPEELRLERNMTWVSVYKAREYLVDYAVGHHF